jgi:LPXTG-motif cell wall-anchored protein
MGEKMKKIKNLNGKAAMKTKLIILAVVLSTIVSLTAGETASGNSATQTAEKLAIAPPHQAAASWDNGTNQKKLMPEDKLAQATTHTQKAMKEPETTIPQAQTKPALPLSQKDIGAETLAQTTLVTQESTEQDIQSTSSTIGSGETGPASANNLLYLGALLVLVLVVVLLVKGRKGGKTDQGKKKE